MSKNALPSFKIVTAGDQSLTTVASSITNIEFMDNIGFQINILTGTATGTFDVQVSIDHKEVNGNVSVTGNWVSLGSPSTQALTSGAPANIYFNVANLAAPFVRLLYTKTSGTGTFDAFICGKSTS